MSPSAGNAGSFIYLTILRFGPRVFLVLLHPANCNVEYIHSTDIRLKSLPCLYVFHVKSSSFRSESSTMYIRSLATRERFVSFSPVHDLLTVIPLHPVVNRVTLLAEFRVARRDTVRSRLYGKAEAAAPSVFIVDNHSSIPTSHQDVTWKQSSSLGGRRCRVACVNLIFRPTVLRIRYTVLRANIRRIQNGSFSLSLAATSSVSREQVASKGSTETMSSRGRYFFQYFINFTIPRFSLKTEELRQR